MDIVADILFLLLAVVASDFVARLLPHVLPFSITRPMIQIALGALIGLSSRLAVTLDPPVFFLLFLPPLLFLDGWRIPPEDLAKDKGTVVQLALGLVVFTVLGVGLFIRWLIPALPLPVAFAVAAVMSPTDPIAVSAIARKVPMSRRMMHILEGESLLNDASGLICFRFALAAAMTGVFSLTGALADFVWVAAGGIVIGSGLTFMLTWLKNLISHRLGEDSGSQILISLLIPFGCYLAADEVQASGILAVVAAGLTMSFVESSGQALAVTRIRRNNFWDVIQFSANGVIFVLLGEQLHDIVAHAATTVRFTGHAHPAWLAVDVIAIALVLAALRFAWVLVSLRRLLFRGRGLGRSGWRMVGVMSLAGVRGAVTLAGVLSLPLALPGGTAFPGRELAVILAMGVIMVSLLCASIGLPLLLGGLEIPPDPARDAEEVAARLTAAHAAIAAIQALEQARSRDQPDADIVTAAAARVMKIYRNRIESRSGDADEVRLAQQGEAVELEMRLAALRAERDDIFGRLRNRTLGSETARKLIREIDLLEVRHSG